MSQLYLKQDDDFHEEYDEDWGFYIDLDEKNKQLYQVQNKININMHSDCFSKSNQSPTINYEKYDNDNEDKYKLSIPQKRFIGFLFLGTSLLCISSCVAATIVFVVL
jgi:hypothetical protein